MQYFDLTVADAAMANEAWHESTFLVVKRFKNHEALPEVVLVGERNRKTCSRRIRSCCSSRFVSYDFAFMYTFATNVMDLINPVLLLFE